MKHLLFLAVVLAPQLVSQDKPPENCTRTGMVVSSVTGDPLNKTELTLEPVDKSAGPVSTATSNAEGRFVMLALEPGRYRLNGVRNGYLEMSYGAKRRGGNGTLIQIDRGQCPSPVFFKLTPFGVIAGTIRDTDGEPLIGAHVIIASRVFVEGKARIDGDDSTDTNDLGEYRFRDLAPGKYYISAEPSAGGWNKVDRSPNSDQPVYAAVSTLYPGVQDLGIATPIEVAAGARVSGIDVTLLRSRVFSVSGRVTLPGGGGANRASISLTDLRTLKDHELHTATKNASGDFELRGVAPGAYLLRADGESLSARLPVQVAAADVSGLRLQLGAEAQVKARVVTEGEKKPIIPDRPLWFTSASSEVYTSYVHTGDIFSARLPPGRYTMSSEGLSPRGYYVKSIRSGDVDVLTDGLTITQTEMVGIEITLAADGGKIEGAVQPAASATVVLIPSRRDRTDLFKTASTDQYGHYEFANVPPGDYKIVAWEDIEPGAWFDPDFFKDIEKFGEAVTVQANGHLTPSLRMAPTLH